MIRPYREDDFEVVTALWFEAMHVAMPEMMKRMGFELEGAREYFRNAIILQDQLWVYESEGTPVAFLGIENDFLDRLYVPNIILPKHSRRIIFGYIPMLPIKWRVSFMKRTVLSPRASV